MDLTNLAAEFPRDAIHWRPQGKPLSKDGRAPVCMALAYIDARDVMDRLDDVCGPDRWQTEFIETPKGRVICRIGILTDNGWVWKGDGAGDTDVEGEKGGISDALKRAAVSWGIGRYLSARFRLGRVRGREQRPVAQMGSRSVVEGARAESPGQDGCRDRKAADSHDPAGRAVPAYGLPDA